MFRDLDDTIKKILDDSSAPPQLLAAEVNFELPDRNFAPAQSTVNLFLYDVHENRILRDPEPIIEKVGNIFKRRTPPLRVDCAYMVTAWDSAAGPVKAANEHRLLSQALQWLSRFPIIPARYLQGDLRNPPFPHRTEVALPDNNRSMGEFWSALGQPPRPSFNLVVTIAMDLHKEEEGPLVTHAQAKPEQAEKPETREDVINIGGLVLNRTGQPVPDAWVRLEPANLIAVTKSEGRFVFERVRSGVGYTLRARAVGLGEARRSIEIPSLTGEYNLQFP